jgi:hypothetical protein
MEEHQRLSVFKAQTENVHELEQAWKQINRQINSSILQRDQKAIGVNTKILALIYCALAEAVFSKLIHTPHGLELLEIEQIKNAVSANGVKAGWVKCAQLAVSRVEGTKHNHRPNVVKKLSGLIQEFIYDPSLIRNKLAHGQWRVALNRENTAVNEEISNELARSTVVDYYRRKHALVSLAAIVENLIESPNKAHRRDYWKQLTELEVKERELSAWTFEHKTEQLFAKKSHAMGAHGSQYLKGNG